MLKDRTHKLAASTWLVVAIFLSAGLAQAEVSDDLNSSIATPETDSLDANAAIVAETDNGTDIVPETWNKTDATEMEIATESVTSLEAVTPAETEMESKGENATVTAPEMVEEEVEEVIHTVCPNGCNYSTIQAAVDAAKDGEVVEVESGTYNENVVVNKSITIRGVDTGEGVPVVNARGSGSTVVLKANGIVLEGLYITNAGPYPSAGIEVVSDDNLIAGNGIWNCKQWGIYLKGGSTNNTISECISSNNGNDGIMVYKAPGNFFKENTIGNNGDNGVQILESDNNIIDRNVVGNNTNSGVYIDASQNAIVMSNIISYNSKGIRLISSGIDRVGPNRFVNNSLDLEVA
jgi:parallel beta-helix repeat protein